MVTCKFLSLLSFVILSSVLIPLAKADYSLSYTNPNLEITCENEDDDCSELNGIQLVKNNHIMDENTFSFCTENRRCKLYQCNAASKTLWTLLHHGIVTPSGTVNSSTVKVINVTVTTSPAAYFYYPNDGPNKKTHKLIEWNAGHYQTVPRTPQKFYLNPSHTLYGIYKGESEWGP